MRLRGAIRCAIAPYKLYLALNKPHRLVAADRTAAELASVVENVFKVATAIKNAIDRYGL
jgi:hypothetical protein